MIVLYKLMKKIEISIKSSENESLFSWMSNTGICLSILRFYFNPKRKQKKMKVVSNVRLTQHRYHRYYQYDYYPH
jgi:hypothetical protein